MSNHKSQPIPVSFLSSLQDDEDGHVVVLTIIEDLMTKTQEAFLDHFARLGVFSKVQALIGGAGSGADGDQAESMIKSQGGGGEEGRSSDGTLDASQDDAKEILPGRAYHWKDWSICRGRDCLYVWSDSAALELSNGSNGWFRFILDGKLATMYSSGSPENGNDSMGKEYIFVVPKKKEEKICICVVHKVLMQNLSREREM